MTGPWWELAEAAAAYDPTHDHQIPLPGGGWADTDNIPTPHDLPDDPTEEDTR